jgi:hypothetical protein
LFHKTAIELDKTHKILRMNFKKNIIETDLWKLVRIFPYVFALHELEEWNILSWHQKYQTNVPDVIDLNLRTIFLLIIGIVFFIFFIAQKIKKRQTAAYILFPVLALSFYNGIVHLYWSVNFITYAPGLIFGFIIGVPLSGIIIYKIISEKLVSKWYVIFFGTLFSALFANIILLGDKIEPFLVQSMLLGKILTKWIWF